MKFIEEIVVEAFLPTYRSMLAERLRDRGYTQSEVGNLLGISQSAVSKYAHGEIDRHPTIEADRRVIALADRVADGLSGGAMSPTEALIEAEVLIRELEAGDLLSELHRQAVPALDAHPDALSIHDPGGSLRERERVLSTLRRELRRLERLGGFASLIPQVGSNLVHAREGATSIDDVAGVPGRILDVMGRATIPGDPEFGVSEHVASVVLAAMAAEGEHRSAINIRFDPVLVDRLATDGHAVAEVEPTAALPAAVEAVIDADPTTAVIFHEDGLGIEANVYLLGADPGAVVDVVRALTVTDG